MTSIDSHADYEYEPPVSDELEIARRTAVSTSYTLSISPPSNPPTGAVHYELLLTEPQARSVRSGFYSRHDAGRIVSTLNQYHDRNSQIAIARSEGRENFNTTQMARALIKVLENPLRIRLPHGRRLEIMLEKRV